MIRKVFLWSLLLLCDNVNFSIALSESGRNVEVYSYYETEKYTEKCGWFGWKKCRRYRTIVKYALRCREGWTHAIYWPPMATDCDLAYCDGLTSKTGACNIHYSDDKIVRRNEPKTIRNSGGTCTAPDICSNCNDGFYGDGPKCRICGKIDHCNHRKCTSATDHICVWCEEEIQEIPYYRAYKPTTDKTSCQQACSWKADSTRCYPGTCEDELAANCVCDGNFSGRHCENIPEPPTIDENFCQFSDKLGNNVVQNNGNYNGSDHPTIWTNYPIFAKVNVIMTAKYKQPPDHRAENHFIRSFSVGVIEEAVTLSWYRGGKTIGYKKLQCDGMDQMNPVTSKTCQFNPPFPDNHNGPYQHDDSVDVEFTTTNGGYVIVADRTANALDEITNTYTYNGLTRSREFKFHWDMENPYHCSQSTNSPCQPFVEIIGGDFTENPNIEFTWGGWADDLSKLSKFSYEIFRLEKSGTSLVDGRHPVDKNHNVALSETKMSATLKQPGMHSLHMIAWDEAGNHKLGRNLFLFDNESIVEIDTAEVPTKCTTASKNTTYKWVVKDTSKVTLTWPRRFMNYRHELFAWLSRVATYSPGGTNIYEDLYGERTNVPFNNKRGIADFKVAFDVFSDTTTNKDTRVLTSISDIHEQQDTLSVVWDDGDRLNMTVVAYDVLGKSEQESVTVYRDATPPVITNLWLTKGDRLNISVHSLEEFTEMRIEWEAYDIHSGLDRVNWRLYDHKTGDEHGYEDIIAQGHAVDLNECQTKYNTYARGANCYCTPFMGCYHQHFQIKPEIKRDGGLKVGKDRGTHEYDYFIEVSVTSKANLTTVLTRKITIDLSPPHAGMVHDGLPSENEIDYQQGLQLKSYWDQFFDRESGVLFYQYIVATSCASKADFSLDLTSKPAIVETYNTFGSHNASSDGTYYFTVVAYNRALDLSDPVCSDGVTIDSSVPGVKEVVVDGSLITGGLIKDSTSTNYYILGSDRVRRLITNVTTECVSKATAQSDIELFPLQKTKKGDPVEVDGRVFCGNSSSAPTSIGLSLFKSSMMEMSWTPVDIPAKVYDYEVGFSSTPGSAAPDIMSFESTKQHAHHRVVHGNVPDGTQFYIIIKSISKSNVEGITTVGPCFMDTTAPEFDDTSGGVTVTLSGDYLVATWPSAAVSDSEELFELDFKFAIGHSSYGTDVQNFEALRAGGSCILSSPPSCTAAKISDLDWYIHGHHTYYMSVKVENTAGLNLIQTSDPYVHDVQLPAKGVVIDCDTQTFSIDVPLKDIEDEDFQADTTSMAARWSGFAHPHLNVRYKISIGTTSGGNDVVSEKDVGTSLSHLESGLTLTPYQKYYFTITAVSSVGNIVVSSDGVTIVTENDALTGIVIYDGELCNTTDLNLDHHEADNRLLCQDDRSVQMSTNSLKAYWTVPSAIQAYTTDAYVSVEKRSGVGSIWMPFQDNVHLSTVFDVSLDHLTLSPGIMYRVVLKLCAKRFCFQPIPSDGVMVIANSPVSGGITVDHINITEGGGTEKLKVSFTKFYDPDIEDTTEKYDAVNRYEFTITDNSVHGKPYITWTKLVTFTTNGDQISFVHTLTGEMDFSRCKRISVRGYNLVSQYSTVSAEIKDCDAYNPILVKPNIVIDAVGAADVLDSIGKPVYLEQNALWLEPDKDYTPYKNLISAVWPTLRHKDYTYAILDAKTIDVTTYYRQVSQLNLIDPCSHPDSIKCGHTINGFVNVEFTGNELVHGTRYTVCVYAPFKRVQHETWIEDLEEVRSCSDGIVVDFTPPTNGRLWIGDNPDVRYQTSSTDLFVTWDGFHDVEEYNTGPHASGVMKYILGIGTTSGGNDVHAFEDVGVVQHKALHNLNLQNGYQYFATLKAIDFANRERQAVSEPITVDYSAPEKSNNPITLDNAHITSTTEVSPCWKGVFTDLESGIDYYMWSIGSEPGYTDIMSYLKVLDNECGTTDKNNPLDLKDGHYYYINVRAFNKAGLSSLATSWAFRVDTTPPTAGHVYDGEQSQVTGSEKDIDFQTETKILHSYWEGFHDSHSTIKEYYISIGTCPQCEDILSEQAIGIAYDFALENIHLGPGLRYYTTVTACNTADMCTTVTSDGVIIDNSPPTAGFVQDGVGIYDTEYQSMRNYVSAKWRSFDDPQSGLARFEWRVGTKPRQDDIISPLELHLTEVAALLNSTHKLVNLPVNRRIYVTVRAYNKAGLWSESSSNGFLVDDSAPSISKAPTFSEDFGIKGMTQIYKTSMKVEWEVEDEQSFTKRQYLSIRSHIGGEFMLSSQHVNGIVRSYVFTGLDLHDGVTYYVTLISCNSADICASSSSKGMFVDSSPPSRGMFAISTDHASDPDLSRHEHGWMTYGTNAVYLAWLGFTDIHSGIDHYMVTVGSSYMAKDLSKDHTEQYIYKDTNTDHGDEGKVQLYEIKTETLTNYDLLFISVWAVTKVGLRSEMIHSAFSKTPPTALDLVRRCDALSCEGHCVCAPQDQKCPYQPSLGSCVDLSANIYTSTDYSVLHIVDTNGYSTSDQAVTASDNVLRAVWLISQQNPSKPKWYEWSVGYAKKTSPIGIFDPVEDKVWKDAGQLTEAVFTVPKDKPLLGNTLVYSVFVRVWYSATKYAVFVTDGIYVMTQPPALAVVRGTAVTEKVQGTTVKDHDYIRIGRPITYTWKNKFLEADATIEKYRLYLSTFPGGYDILTVKDVIPGTATGFNMSRINLTPGVRYYSNVVAYNYAGAHTTSSSDGFIVDHIDPFDGIVYDGLGTLDQEYRNSSDTVSAHWHGFVDTESGIQSYFWCVGETTFIHRTYEKSECSILPWTNVGLHVSASRNLSSDIPQGTKLYNKVYAVDEVGKRSSISISDGVIVDKTPPIAEKFIHNAENIVDNPSFEDTNGDEIMWENITTTDICMVSNSYHPSSWIPSVVSCLGVISSDVNMAIDGRSFLYIRGSVHQKLVKVTKGRIYKISFFSSHLPTVDSVSANKEGFLELGDTHHVFLIYTKPYRNDGHVESIDRKKISWHLHTFYFKSTETMANITIGSMDITTGIFIDHLSVQEVNLTTTATSGQVIGHVVYLHEWSSIHGSWGFVDPESPIVDYSWAIGYTAGGTQIQPFRSVGLMNFAFNNNVTLVHNTFVYVTTIATNAAGLKGVSYSDNILVDLTPPDIKFVNDGAGTDEEAWELNEVIANWEVEDLESGILQCQWAIGYKPGGNDLMTYTLVTANGGYKEFPYSVLTGRIIYTTLNCENKAGLFSTLSSNGVKISDQPPSIASAEITMLPLSPTEYTPDKGFQGVTDNIRMKWTGFTDDIGIERYKVNYKADDTNELMFFADVQDVLYAHFIKMKLNEVSQNFSVQAINKLFKRSDRVFTELTVHTTPPSVDGTKKLDLSWVSEQVIVSWDQIFTSSGDIFYEVSAGSTSSGVNIVQWQETNQTSITFGIPASVSATTGLPVFVTVRGVSDGGYSAVKTGKFTLP